MIRTLFYQKTHRHQSRLQEKKSIPTTKNKVIPTDAKIEEEEDKKNTVQIISKEISQKWEKSSALKQKSTNTLLNVSGENRTIRY